MRDTCVGTPDGDEPAKARTSHTLGRRSLIVATPEDRSDDQGHEGWDEG